MELKRRLAKLLMDKSYRAGEVTLTSGRKSDYYFDCKQTALHPEGGWLIGKIFSDMLAAEAAAGRCVDGVAGMTLGADPLVSAVSIVSYLEGTPLPAMIVRKQSKGHGTDQFLEGLANFAPGARIAMLEDVVTTGGTLIKACERVTSAGFTVAAVLAVLDRQEGGTEALQQAGLPLTSIFTRRELLAAAS